MYKKQDTKYALLKAKAENSKKLCKVDGCREHRWSLTTYCRKHGARKQNHGHPVKGRTIFPSEYALEQQLAEDYCMRHSRQPTIQEAVKVIELWLADAALNVNVVGQPYLVRLHEEYIQPKAVLYRLMGLWSWAWAQPHIIDDTDQLTYALGNVITSYVKQPQQTLKGVKIRRKYPTGKERKEIGKYIRAHLGLFLLSYTQAIHSVLAEKKKRVQLLAQSLPSYEASLGNHLSI